MWFEYSINNLHKNTKNRVTQNTKKKIPDKHKIYRE
jgi:hypothetical protein